MSANAHWVPVEHAEAAQWLAESLERLWGRSKNANYAAAVIPRGFASYARIFHPARCGIEDREVTWSEVAKCSGRKPHAQMQWPSIAAGADLSGNRLSGGIEPEIGRLPDRQAKTLIEILRQHTNTPERCYFAIWDGWGFPEMETLRKETAGFQLPDRSYLLMQGDICAATSRISAVSQQTANIWWPEDRAWCLATEVDLMCTYVGGTDRCIEHILTDSRLEAWPATLDDRIDKDGDRINRVHSR